MPRTKQKTKNKPSINEQISVQNQVDILVDLHESSNAICTLKNPKEYKSIMNDLAKKDIIVNHYLELRNWAQRMIRNKTSLVEQLKKKHIDNLVNNISENNG
eukprot:180756_1